MERKAKVFFVRLSGPDEPPLFRFTVIASNGRIMVTSEQYDRLAKAQAVWRKLRKSMVDGTVAEEYVI
jgi:uncharacterized protein YegP (UPF0339 family)